MFGLCIIDRVKRLREDAPRSSSQSRQDGVEDSQRSVAARRSRSRSRDQRRSRNYLRSTPDRSTALRPSRPYAAVLAAQLSQRRKQLEARAKEKLKTEKDNRVKSPAIDGEGTKAESRINSPRVKEKKKTKIVIEIQDDEEQNVTDCQTEAGVDLSNDLPPSSVRTDDTSVKEDDGDDASTAAGTPSSANDTSTVDSDRSKSDTGQMAEGHQTSTECSANKPTSATLSLMNLPMPPVDSESDSEATPVSTAELQL